MFKSNRITFDLLFSLIIILSLLGCSSSGTDQTPDANATSNTASDDTATASDFVEEMSTPSQNVSAKDTGNNPNLYVNTNNNARLTGPLFGRGELYDSALMEEVSIAGYSTSVGLRMVSAYAIRNQYYNNKSDVVVALHNSTAYVQCGQIENIRSRQKSGTELPVKNVYPDGSNYYYYTQSGGRGVIQCVPPNSIVYGTINLHSSKGYNNAEVSFGSIDKIYRGTATTSAKEHDGAGSTAPVVPLSYSVNNKGDIEVLVENQDSVQFIVNAKAYAINEEGLPVFKFATDKTQSIEPGQTVILTFAGNQFPGSASTLRVVLSLES